MSYLDIIIALLFLLAIVMGWRQGFIRQLFGLLALLLGVYCAYKFSHFAAHYIAKWFEVNEPVTNSVAFAITFIVVLVVVIIIGRFADRIITMVAFGWLNRLLGIILSVIKIGLIIAVCIVILDMFDIVPARHIQKSYLYQPLENIGTTVFPYLKKLVNMALKL